MKDDYSSYPGFGKEAPITSVQPGGGWGMSIELAWGRFRRWCLRAYFPQYVNAQRARRLGECNQCQAFGRACDHDTIDERDLKYYLNVCQLYFPPEGNRFAWRRQLLFASWGLAELIVFTLVCMLASAFISVLAWLGSPAWLVWLLCATVLLFWLEIVWFFRNPSRQIPSDVDALLSPADGTIVELAEVDAEGFPGGRAFRVGIFLSVFNVHINRAPCAARITALRFYPGRFLNAMKTISARVNEQLWIDMLHETRQIPLRLTQISGALAHRIVCEWKPGQVVQPGEKFGMIKLGSRTELYLPAGTAHELNVKVGDKVKGGATILLRLK